MFCCFSSHRAYYDDVDAASCAIVKFLEIESTEELSNGWMLLCTINLLSMGADSLIDSMTVASLPSTLVKCLYLFFDLPDIYQPDTLQPGCEFTPRESRVLLQKVFVQVRVLLNPGMSTVTPRYTSHDIHVCVCHIQTGVNSHPVCVPSHPGKLLVTGTLFMTSMCIPSPSSMCQSHPDRCAVTPVCVPSHPGVAFYDRTVHCVYGRSVMLALATSSICRIEVFAIS